LIYIQDLIKKIHIVSFDIPFPADYGGVVDVFFKIKALCELGVSIHLHCFQYGRKESSELLELCDKVTYYKRKKSFLHLLSRKPFVVNTRINKQLLANLLKDDSPVLLEGLHCSWYIPFLKLKGKKVFFRAHNIEHHYYQELASAESSFLKKIYYRLEAYKLQNQENVLAHSSGIFCISPNDFSYFENRYSKAIFIPAFHSNNKVFSLLGRGNYALYHGNLSVAENVKAVKFLVNEVFDSLEIPLIVAGKSPCKELLKMNSANVTIVSNPSELELAELVQKAHMNVLPSFQSTGIKLKLLFALFNGRYCLISPQLMPSKKILKTAIICDSAQQWKDKIIETSNLKFGADDLIERETYAREFDNLIQANKLIEWI
tara:strand:- start:326 stop:1447 length:1122 start_codon:yes stop_codon:yes gene_type:complete